MLEDTLRGYDMALVTHEKGWKAFEVIRQGTGMGSMFDVRLAYELAL